MHDFCRKYDNIYQKPSKEGIPLDSAISLLRGTYPKTNKQRYKDYLWGNFWVVYNRENLEMAA